MSEMNVIELLKAGSAIGDLKEVNGVPFAVVPDGYKLSILEDKLDAPQRKTGTVVLDDVESFVRYYKAHQSESSTIYGDLNPEPGFVAVFNDHANEPGWRDFKAEYSCPLSIEWQTWMARNGKQFLQEDFARFIEDNNLDVVEPAAADMLLVSRTLEAKKNVNFASGIRLSNGEQELIYEETIQGTAAKGKLSVPETFVIGIAVFEGGARYKVTARLRYRINGGKLVMWYDILRPHKILEDAAKEVWQTIEKSTETTIYNGRMA